MTEPVAVGTMRCPEIDSVKLGSPVIREATLDDYPHVAALQSRNGLKGKPPAEWRAIWSENPVRRHSLKHLPIGWILETPAAEVVGFLGCIPLEYSFEGRSLLAATAYSWVVDKPHRGYSMMLLDRFLRQTWPDLVVFTTVNEAAARALRAFKLNRIPVDGWDTTSFWITGYQSFAKGIAQAIPIATPITPLLTAGLWLWARSHSFLFHRTPRANVVIEQCHAFDRRFEKLWQQIKTERSSCMLAVRNQEALAWHYGPGLRSGNLRIVGAFQNGQLQAYWIVDRRDHEGLGLKRLRFVDFQALSGSEDLVMTAVDWALATCRRERIDVLENAGCWLTQFGKQKIFAPYKRKMKSWLFYYKARDPGLALKLRNRAAWLPTTFDGDSSL